MNDKTIIKLGKFVKGAFFSLAVVFLGICLWDLKNYFQKNEESDAQISKWEVLNENESKYFVAAEYSYEAHGKEYSNREIIKGVSFPSEKAALYFIDHAREKTWRAKFQSSNPSNGSLQNFFPFKSVIRAIITVLTSIYFYFLLRYFFKKIKDV